MNAQTLFEWISDAIKYAGIREYKYFRQISGMKVEYSAGEKENTIYRLTIGDTVIYENGAFRIIFYKTLGLLTPETVKTVIFLIPFALSGLFTGMKCCGHMNDKKVHKITTVLLILSGISLVLKNL